jgi:DNA-binding NarL/FixJ family response regulator
MPKLIVLSTDERTIGAVFKAFGESSVGVLNLAEFDSDVICRTADGGELVAVIFDHRSVRLYHEMVSRLAKSNDCLRATRFLLVRPGICSATVYKALASGVDDVIELDQPAEHFASDISLAVSGIQRACDKFLVPNVDVIHRPAAPRICVHDDTEMNIVGMVAAGYMDREIAEVIHYSHQTVRNKISRILEDSNLRNRTQLAAAYLIERIISDSESWGGQRSPAQLN